MMKTDQHKKIIIKVDSNVEQENVKKTRKGLKTLQPAATDKENLAGRIHFSKDTKLGENEAKKHKALLMHKGTQTEKYITNIDDLTGEEATADYWKRLAEKRQDALDESFQEIEKLKENVEALQEENKICKEMLEESRHLVEVLQEMINEGETEDSQVEESESTDKKDSDNESNGSAE